MIGRAPREIADLLQRILHHSDRSAHNIVRCGADHHRPLAEHQRGVRAAQRLCERGPQRRSIDQSILPARNFAKVEDRNGTVVVGSSTVLTEKATRSRALE